jgi:HSP20 family protein
MRSLMPWRDSHVIEEARKEFDDMVRRLFAPSGEGEGNGRKTTWSPHIDLSESDKSVVVKADIPGVDPKDIDITVEDGVLTIKGEKKEEREEKKQNFHRTERFVGQFFRQISLPSGADEQNVSATTAKGVITITIPKKPGSHPKKITVQEAK